ncbi:MAG: hypothetical protein QOG43_3358 [Actinomycetota bacterium]|jgi:2-polyprenyl-3-methyl-5-hydroxy-6-metoxy-1,4-benzoquinol methylase|nr:hypothetical protein [Actinomycetota bacterium]
MPDAETGPEAACVLCGSGEAREPLLVDVADHRYHVEGRWEFRRCRTCRLVALHPFPDDVAAGYPEAYSQHRVRAPSTGTPARSPVRRWLRRHSLAGLGYGAGRVNGAGGAGGAGGGGDAVRPGPVDRLVAAVPALRMEAQWGCILVPGARPGGRLLDVGCGAGRYLLVMKALGWDVVGVEPDAGSRAVAESQGLRVVPTLADGDLAPGSFDVITLNHVIEHLADPVAELRSLRPLLAPDGLLGVATPNWASLGRRFFGPSWYALEAPRHLVLFDPATLRATVEAAGFRVTSRATRSAREGPETWKISWAVSRRQQPSRSVVAVGTAVSCAAAFVGAGEEIEQWATLS